MPSREDFSLKSFKKRPPKFKASRYSTTTLVLNQSNNNTDAKNGCNKKLSNSDIIIFF